LTALVKKKGVVKVIVRLNVPGIEELTHSAAQLKDPAAIAKMDKEMANRITAVADSVLNQLKDTHYKINHRYDSLPLLSLDISAEALKILSSSPDVIDITEDKSMPIH